MGINHLQLTPELIAALYPESLVAGIDPQPVEKAAKANGSAPAYPFLGKNNRSISFLTHYPDGGFLPEEQLVFLQKILTACKYSLDDIALINTSKLSFELAELRIQFHPLIIFLWGIQPASVGLTPDLPDLRISLLDGISVIPVLSPGLMSSDKPEGIELKKRLWACLKKLFTL
jgi:hypothetical protein